MATFIDSFNRIDSANLGANWDSGYTDRDPLTIVSNAVEATVLAVDAFETVNAITVENNQFAEFVITGWTGTVERRVFLALRAAVAPTVTWYQAQINANRGDAVTSHIFKLVNGTLTMIATESGTTWAVNDRAQFTVDGTTLKLYRNGVLLLSGTDTELTGGRIGIGNFVATGGALTDAIIDDFLGGDLGAIRIPILQNESYNIPGYDL